MAMRGFAAALLLLSCLSWETVCAAESDIVLLREHGGVELIALSPDAEKRFDSSLVPAGPALRNIAVALDRLVDRSPLAARRLDTLKQSGRVLIVYRPDDLRNVSGSESIATFHPDYLREPGRYGREKIFLVAVGRHGVKWPADELAAVLAHELVGHGIQHLRGRLSKVRVLDAECEASLYEEIANQDLRLDKRSREMIAFRQSLEYRWCADFKAYMRRHRPGAMKLWNTLNPDVPKLLVLFDAYLDHEASTGVTAKALLAKKHQTRVARMGVLKDAGPEALFRVAVILRDGGIGVAPDIADAIHYFRIAAGKGSEKAKAQLDWLKHGALGNPPRATEAFGWFSRAALQTERESVRHDMSATGLANDLD